MDTRAYQNSLGVWKARRILARVGLSVSGMGLVMFSIQCNDNGDLCAGALAETEQGIGQLCELDTYRPSQFCRICVPNGFFSVDDSCTCKSLTFNADYCYYSTGSAATPQLRGALDYAVQVCSDRSAKLPYSCAELDAASSDSAVACPGDAPGATPTDASSDALLEASTVDASQDTLPSVGLDAPGN
jgi:hypothetical protein